jgi:hypothetical protein
MAGFVEGVRRTYGSFASLAGVLGVGAEVEILRSVNLETP